MRELEEWRKREKDVNFVVFKYRNSTAFASTQKSTRKRELNQKLTEGGGELSKATRTRFKRSKFVPPPLLLIADNLMKNSTKRIAALIKQGKVKLTRKSPVVKKLAEAKMLRKLAVRKLKIKGSYEDGKLLLLGVTSKLNSVQKDILKMEEKGNKVSARKKTEKKKKGKKGARKKEKTNRKEKADKKTKKSRTKKTDTQNEKIKEDTSKLAPPTISRAPQKTKVAAYAQEGATVRVKDSKRQPTKDKDGMVKSSGHNSTGNYVSACTLYEPLLK